MQFTRISSIRIRVIVRACCARYKYNILSFKWIILFCNVCFISSIAYVFSKPTSLIKLGWFKMSDVFRALVLDKIIFSCWKIWRGRCGCSNPSRDLHKTLNSKWQFLYQMSQIWKRMSRVTYSTCGTLKNSHCSLIIIAEHWSKFARLHFFDNGDASIYMWTILERDEKQINRQLIINNIGSQIHHFFTVLNKFK